MTFTTQGLCRACVCGLLLLAIVPLVGADDAKKVGGDLKKLQGTWVNAAEAGPDLKWTFEGESLKAVVDGAEYTCETKLDEAAKPHSTMDLTIKQGPGDSAGKTGKAIYKFDGEKVFICVTTPGVETRPTEFKAAEGEAYLFELKKK